MLKRGSDFSLPFVFSFSANRMLTSSPVTRVAETTEALEADETARDGTSHAKS